MLDWTAVKAASFIQHRNRPLLHAAGSAAHEYCVSESLFIVWLAMPVPVHYLATAPLCCLQIGAATTFDAEVYRQSILDHAQQQQASKQRNCGSGAGAAGGGSCPFATSDEFKQQWQREDYHPKAAGKAFADKVGHSCCRGQRRGV